MLKRKLQINVYHLVLQKYTKITYLLMFKDKIIYGGYIQGLNITKRK